MTHREEPKAAPAKVEAPVETNEKNEETAPETTPAPAAESSEKAEGPKVVRLAYIQDATGAQLVPGVVGELGGPERVWIGLKMLDGSKRIKKLTAPPYLASDFAGLEVDQEVVVQVKPEDAARDSLASLPSS